VKFERIVPIVERIVPIVARASGRADLTEETELDHLGLNSLERVELMIEIEEAFDQAGFPPFNLDDDDIAKMVTLGDLVRLIDRVMVQKAS